ncbi:MAG: hypothetical protein ABEN55_01030, partial [Bradymonadaceae bacterium]
YDQSCQRDDDCRLAVAHYDCDKCYTCDREAISRDAYEKFRSDLEDASKRCQPYIEETRSSCGACGGDVRAVC